ncbi:hypothetical protein [Nitratireductor sp. L15S-10]|uniref:hypothetical protein n=1 Tax=Nitratireductor sp. L15S-10 TaxID=3034028 RepID=UPI003857C487
MTGQTEALLDLQHLLEGVLLCPIIGGLSQGRWLNANEKSEKKPGERKRLQDPEQ